ncbi:MAG: methyl-accepting chemotaxis protein [Ruminococcus sp.]|nr:methyl-accepting chemotaxis protein [Ruminococcus sp.]
MKRKSMGLIKAIQISVMLATSITLLCVIVIGYAASYSKIRDGVISTTEESLNSYAAQIGGWLELQGEFTKAQANAAGKVGELAGDHSRSDDFIDSVMLLNSALLDCYTAYEDVSLYMAVTDTSTLPAGFDATTRSWYIQAKETRDVVFTSPYTDTATGSMIFTIAYPIYENGDFAGVFGCDITLDSIMEIANSMKVTDNSEVILIDNENNFMLHPNTSYAPRIADGEAVSTSYIDAGGDYAKILGGLGDGVLVQKGRDEDRKQRYFAFTRLEAAGWILGCDMPVSDITGALSGLAVVYVVMFVIFFLASNAAVIIVMKQQVKPLKNIASVADDMANGVLSAQFSYYSSDEIGKMCASFDRCTETTRKYIKDISEKLERIARGDFTVEVTEEYVGDYNSIKRSMINIIKSMRDTLNNIDSASKQVNSGASMIADMSTGLARSVSDQTENIRILSDDMSSIIEKVKENNINTSEARLLAGSAKDKIEKSNDYMKELLSAMNRISDMSKEIAKIIKAIDDIAFQTNILALNASVEAAKAGAAGKGFTVVAEEVRMLAGKSAEAASRTSRLIDQTSRAVAEGSRLADLTAQSLSEAVEDTVSVDENIVKIADTVSSENEYMDHIFESINIISKRVNETSDSAHSGAASSEELSGQADILEGLISKFRL